MTTKLSILIMPLIFISCVKKEIPIDPSSSSSDTIEFNRSSNLIINRSPIMVAVPNACGYGLNVGITFDGNAVLDTFPYEIRLSGSNSIVDSGTISNGGATNWVLAPCTNYDFEFFWGSPNCSSCSTTQTITSDGCNGTFIC